MTGPETSHTHASLGEGAGASTVGRGFFNSTIGLTMALLTIAGISHRVCSYATDFDVAMGQMVFAPGSTVHYGLEGDGFSTWTTHGIRGQNERADSSTSPIIVLGDSFTEALQVDDDTVFTHLLEESLKERGIANPVFNLGRAGCSVADYIGLAPRYKSLFEPAWVIIQVNQSDFTEDAWNSEKDEWAHFYRSGSDDDPGIVLPVAEDPARKNLLHRVVHALGNDLAIVQFTHRRIEDLETWVKHEPKLFVASRTAKPIPPEESWKAYPVREELQALASAYGGRLTLLFLSEFDPRSPGQNSEFEKFLERTTQEMGIGLAKLSDGYRVLAREGAAPFGFSNGIYNQGHMNRRGHELAAEVLTREMIRSEKSHGLH